MSCQHMIVSPDLHQLLQEHRLTNALNRIERSLYSNNNKVSVLLHYQNLYSDCSEMIKQLQRDARTNIQSMTNMGWNSESLSLQEDVLSWFSKEIHPEAYQLLVDCQADLDKIFELIQKYGQINKKYNIILADKLTDEGYNDIVSVSISVFTYRQYLFFTKRGYQFALGRYKTSWVELDSNERLATIELYRMRDEKIEEIANKKRRLK